MSRILNAIVAGIDRCSEWLGISLAWLTVAMMIVTCVVVALRYGFGEGSIALQESVTYMHALVFLLAAGYTLKHDGHVRVDIVYQRFGPRGRSVVDLLGGLLLLLPLCGFIIWSSWDYVAASWRVTETSPEPDGIPLVYLLKTLIPVGAGLLALQGFAEVLRAALFLAGLGPAHEESDAANV